MYHITKNRKNLILTYAEKILLDLVDDLMTNIFFLIR